MKSLWSEEGAAELRRRYAEQWGDAVALRLYTSRLLGSEPSLVLHGGGNTSVKTQVRDLLGRERGALFVKASGHDLRTLEPEGLCGLDLDPLLELAALPELDDGPMYAEFARRALVTGGPAPSLEALVHAFLPPIHVDHTHADAILALTNRANGEALVREALGEDVVVLPYVDPGFALAKAASVAFARSAGTIGMVWLRHGLVTWGPTARISYEAMIEIVTRAETFLTRRSVVIGAPAPPPVHGVPPGERSAERGRISVDDGAVSSGARERLARVAPILRGLLATPSGDPDRPHRTVILAPLADDATRSLLASPAAKGEALTPPLTSDHLIRTRARPLWLDAPSFEDEAKLRTQMGEAIAAFASDYERYVARHAGAAASSSATADFSPRVVILPGLGIFGAGPELRDAKIARDIAARTIRVKVGSRSLGAYQALDESTLFRMEHRAPQQAKLGRGAHRALAGRIALVTGAAGAIGAGICEELLEHGALVAATDLRGDRLERLAEEIGFRFGERSLPVAMDVTDEASVAEGFDHVVRTWGGLDIVVAAAGVAHVAPLAELEIEAFRKIARVNVEGTLLTIAAAGRLLGRQATGGDLVLVSSKNVFSPGAGFGAYSATKASAHQLARIASLELAGIGVRVNMVAPDAVFGEGERRSGLWDAVGPDRMRARGLDADQLEEYYKDRNLLKIRITPRHVARAVFFLVSRQAPVTGVTLPVDGGLPDATPR